MDDANDYKFLWVDLKIKRELAEVFEQQMVICLPKLFEKDRSERGLGWKLLFAGKPATQSDDAFAYRHLWRMPRDSVVADAMILLGRDSDYFTLDQTKISEIQDIFRVAAVYSPEHTGGDDEAPTHGMHALAAYSDAPLFIEEVEAPGDWFKLHEWQEAMPTIAAEARQDPKATLLFATQAETGLLRRFYNLWRPEARTVTAESLEEFLVEQKFKQLRPSESLLPGMKPREYAYPKTRLVQYKEVDYRNRPEELPAAAQ